MDFENLNILPIHNVLADVDRIVVILGHEEERRMKETLDRIIRNMYNKYQRAYMLNNPEKRRAVQEKYRDSHPKTEEQRIKDREYSKAYYLKKKEEKRIINLRNSDIS